MENSEILINDRYQSCPHVIWYVVDIKVSKNKIVNVVPFNEEKEQIGPSSWRDVSDKIFRNKVN